MDNPHRSGTESSVHGRTYCTFNVSEIGVTTELWNLAWFGWNFLASDQSIRYSANNSQDAHPHHACIDTTDNVSFAGESSHWTIENGTEYVGGTENIKDFPC